MTKNTEKILTAGLNVAVKVIKIGSIFLGTVFTAGAVTSIYMDSQNKKNKK